MIRSNSTASDDSSIADGPVVRSVDSLFDHLIETKDIFDHQEEGRENGRDYLVTARLSFLALFSEEDKKRSAILSYDGGVTRLFEFLEGSNDYHIVFSGRILKNLAKDDLGRNGLFLEENRIIGKVDLKILHFMHTLIQNFVMTSQRYSKRDYDEL